VRILTRIAVTGRRRGGVVAVLPGWRNIVRRAVIHVIAGKVAVEVNIKFDIFLLQDN
jgi:hypothetical protein